MVKLTNALSKDNQAKAMVKLLDVVWCVRFDEHTESRIRATVVRITAQGGVYVKREGLGWFGHSFKMNGKWPIKQSVLHRADPLQYRLEQLTPIQAQKAKGGF